MKIFLKITLSIFLFTLISWSAQSQVAERKWNRGAVILKTNDTIRGVVKHNLTKSLVQVKVNNVTRIYSAQQVSYYMFYDTFFTRDRVFFSIPYARRKHHLKKPTFFEVIYIGNPLTIISRPAVMASKNFHNFDNYYELARFYFIDKKDKIVRVKRTKTSLFRVLKRHQKEMKKFLKGSLEDIWIPLFIQVTDLYNNLERASK